jgi:hypothetical protein
MSDNQITRVNYFERQFLRTQDFADEQAYHVAMRRRHNIAHHTWGVVGGLELVAEEGGLFVQPGMAVDGYGRELILPARQPLSTAAFVDKGSDELEVWLVYERRGTDSPPEGYAGCGGAGADLFYRWQETARVRLERPDPDFPDRRAPQAVRLADRDFSPARTPPEDADWPVFLGRLIRDPANAKQPHAVDESGRPFVGLVGEAVYAPSGRAVVQVGAESADDPHRFAVFVAGVSDPDDPTPQLSIDAAGDLSVERDATFYGDLTMAGGRIEFEAGEARQQARPWSVCHVEDESGAHELRVEMARAPQGGELGNNRVVVGAWFKGPDGQGGESEAFHPCLTIDDGGTVTVHGNLVVLGQLTEAGPRAAAGITQEARSFITGGYMSGVSGTSSLFPARAPAPDDVITLAAPAPRSARAGDAGVDALALNLEADPEQLAAFAERLKTKHPELAEKLRAALEGIVEP